MLVFQDIPTILYVSDTVLIADNETDLQNLVDAVVVYVKQQKLELNCKNTEIMVTSKKT